jgi:hypothetical protein
MCFCVSRHKKMKRDHCRAIVSAFSSEVDYDGTRQRRLKIFRLRIMLVCTWNFMFCHEWRLQHWFLGLAGFTFSFSWYNSQTNLVSQLSHNGRFLVGGPCYPMCWSFALNWWIIRGWMPTFAWQNRKTEQWNVRLQRPNELFVVWTHT